MPRLARDETAAITAVALGLALLAHRWLLARIGVLVRLVDDGRAELD